MLKNNKKIDAIDPSIAEELKKRIHQFKEECLPDAEAPFDCEAEVWAGMKHFIQWMESNAKSNQLYPDSKLVSTIANVCLKHADLS